MNLFEGVEFQGTFRRFQQRVLDNVEDYRDLDIFVPVVPPGSGKTVLGLELIRRAGERCLIITPTETTRDRWGKSLREHFLIEDKLFEEIFSTDLDNAKVINVITYEEFVKRGMGGRAFSLRKTIPRNHIKTLCLDATHNMTEEVKRAWSRTYRFWDKKVNRIQLFSALPNISINEEIILPELVAEKVLCPHQDYVYFSYPHREELREVSEYMERVGAALKEIGKLEMLKDVPRAIKKENIRKCWAQKTSLYYKKKEYVYCKERMLMLIPFLQYYELDIDWRSVKKLTGKTKLSSVSMKMLEGAIQFLLVYREVPLVWRTAIRKILMKYRLYEDGVVRFVPDKLIEKISPMSLGKLQSICEITKQEYEALGKDLRLLVFTDGMYEKRQHFSYIGTSMEFKEVDVISVFETLRRQDMGVKIGVLTERMLILPDLPQIQGTMLKKEPLGETGYCTIEVVGDMQEAIFMLKQLFQQGELQVLIGNQRLMEGEWRKTNINSLILPGFSKNAISAEIMRWTALQRESDKAEKVVNIWHLTSLVPEDMVGSIGTQSTVQPNRISKSYLYSRELVEIAKRFEQFIGPGYDYEKGEMKSGIYRITLLRPPYDASGIQRINKEMLEYAADREKVGRWWKENVESKSLQLVQETEFSPKKIRSIIFTIGGKSLLSLFSLALYVAFLPHVFLGTLELPYAFLMFLVNFVLVVVGILFLCFVKNVFMRWWKQRNLKAALEYQGELLKADLVKEKDLSADGKVVVKKEGLFPKKITIQLQNASLKEQNIFNEAIIKKITPKEEISETKKYILMYNEEEKNG